MAEGKKSVPFITILESVSLQNYWSTDWSKLFDLHGLQASEGFNSTNSETVKNFPSPSCYWINLKLRCLFVKLLTKYFKTRLFLHLVSLVLELLLPLPLLYTPNVAGGLQTACWSDGLSEMEGKTCSDVKGQRRQFLISEGWRVGLCFGVVFICSTDQQRCFTQQRIVCRGSEEGSGYVTVKMCNFIWFCCWDT